jgi:ankyrin repeat protein
MLAACHGQLDLVQLLTENGADINIQDKGGSSALMYAAKHDHALIVKYLLSQHNCDASITDHVCSSIRQFAYILTEGTLYVKQHLINATL